MTNVQSPISIQIPVSVFSYKQSTTSILNSYGSVVKYKTAAERSAEYWHGFAEAATVIEDEVLSCWEAEVRVGDTLLDDRRVDVNVERPNTHEEHAHDSRQQPKHRSQTTT